MIEEDVPFTITRTSEAVNVDVDHPKEVLNKVIEEDFHKVRPLNGTI